MALRIGFSVILLLSILFMPWWLSVILGLLGILLFSVFWESIVLFFISDLIYGAKEPRFLNLMFVASIMAILALVSLELLKKKLRFYNEK
ncbi:MAG: hypothetical protein AAB943_00725 [Patescibacteria group bacterium]